MLLGSSSVSLAQGHGKESRKRGQPQRGRETDSPLRDGCGTASRCFEGSRTATFGPSLRDESAQASLQAAGRKHLGLGTDFCGEKKSVSHLPKATARHATGVDGR